jgi:hypothetical protein
VIDDENEKDPENVEVNVTEFDVLDQSLESEE